MNILMITADDMSYNSTGMGGCEFRNITPTIDELGKSGVFFENFHTTIGICQPARSVMMTGLYPWNNGATGFCDVNENVVTLVEILKDNNFYVGIIGKASHLSPQKKFDWDDKPLVNGWNQGGYGCNKQFYYEWCKQFMSKKKPFFLMANSHHPHRDFPQDTRHSPYKVVVPKFLVDTPEVRKEISQYYEGVSRCDEMVCSILKALKETGNADNTLIIFTSDHGMAFPFIKANCYHFGSKIPLIIKYPNIQPRIDSSLMSGIDLMPTILKIVGIDCPKVDGHAWGYKNEYIYTCFCKSWSNISYEMRAIHDLKFCYVRNFWSDGIKQFIEDGALDWQPSVDAMKNSKMYIRLKYRTKEEFYNICDPLFTNMVTDKKYYNLMKKAALLAKDNYAIQFFRSEIKQN